MGYVPGLAQWSARLDPPRTQFVKDRIVETTYDGAGYIIDLLHIERFLSAGTTNIGGSFLSGGLRHTYPVEYAAIRAELKEGVYMDPAAFHAHKNQTSRERAQALAEEARRQDEAERAWWRALSGRE
jgi:hypothetical protein